MRKATLVAIVLGLSATASAVSSQDQTSETARKHLDSGMQFYAQGRFKQALNDFEIVVSMEDSNYADDALLKIGEYYLDVESNFDTAKEFFDRVLKSYPTKDAAPGAYYYLGLVTLRSGSDAQAIDDALANFQRVIKLYPQSFWVPAALYSTGTALERRGAWVEAGDSYFRVVSEYPSSDWAAGAQLGIGRCSVRLGKPMQGMIEIQRSRNLYPESRVAPEALEWLTLLFRFYGYPELARPISFRPDAGFRPALAKKFDDVISVRLSPAGVHLLEKGKKRVLTFGPDGKLVGTKNAPDPRGLSVDPTGVLIVSNEKNLMIGERPLILAIPGEKEPKPLEHIRLAVRNRLGEIFVYDDKQKKILRFKAGGELVSAFPDTSQREVLRLEMDPLGNLIVLDKKDRSISVYTPGGRRVARIDRRGDRWELKKPTDIAANSAGYLYVLDEDVAQVVVFDPSYNFLTLLTPQNLGGGVLKKPVSLDVDGSGDIYVYDKDAKALVRFH